jgi:pimeloyl-ACP methyl ester carboxylesterase
MRRRLGFLVTRVLLLVAGSAFALVIASICPMSAQEPQIASVDGHSMRVQVVGPNDATKTPVVVFESGAGTGLDTWTAVLADVGQFARAVAYDRAGIGGSEPDGQAPTPVRVARRLRRMLAQLDLQPPYVLVGHSWGGPLIRTFVALYPKDVAGMVYVDPTHLQSREQELDYLRANGYSAEEARKNVEHSREQFAMYVRSRRGSYRAEMEVILANERSYFADFWRLPPVPVIPVSVLIAGRFDPAAWMQRPCEPRACHEQWLRFRTEWLKAFAPKQTQGTVAVVAGSGHEIHRDDPSLVVSTIRQVLSAMRATP